MAQLHYLIGDAIEPLRVPALVCHCNNDSGGWGRGFVVALSQKYPEAEKRYRSWFATGSPKLGDVQFVQVTPLITIANMIAQHGTKWEGEIPPIRYDAMEECLKKAYEKALRDNLTVSCPRLGSVLAGGDWNTIESILKRTMTVDTYVYTLKDQKDKWTDEYENC